MLSISAISCAPAVNEWLEKSRQPRILHIFEHACNLINERREVLSIVTPRIGNGPFNLVLAEDFHFSDTLDIASSIVISSGQLTLGTLMIDTANAEPWNPRPDWERLHAEKVHLSKQLSQLGVTNDQIGFLTVWAKNPGLQSHLFGLCSALARIDLSSVRKLAARLAGAGIGLTPAGDDLLLGAMYAAWIIHPAEVASVLVQEIPNTAAPLTTSLSAAWLRSAGRGEAGDVWHRFFDALLSSDAEAARDALDRVLSVGHTSGADAFAGFLATLAASFVLVGSTSW